jgi:glycosyltransferase involved in cell wall biosynthesis
MTLTRPAVPAPTRRIAVLPACDDEPTIAAVLDELGDRVDELVVVDNGSTDGTRRRAEAWLHGHDGTNGRLLGFDENRGRSAAYELAFTDLRRRLADGELDSDDLVFTVDADGCPDLALLDDLYRRAVDDDLDALLVRRDLSGAPAYARVGHQVLSAWATLWSGGVRLPDVGSGHRVFRLGPLVDALDYYRGYRSSETVEVAVVLSRLSYVVDNDVVVPLPEPRPRFHPLDTVIDLAAAPVAAFRVTLCRQKHRPVPSLLPPIAATLGVVAAAVLLPVALVRRRRRR